MNKRLLVALLALCAASAHARQLESQLPHGLDDALRCAYFADKAELSSAQFMQVALRISKEAYPELSNDAFTVQFAENYALAVNGAHSQINTFAERANPSAESYEDISKALVTGAKQLMIINRCETITK